MYWIEFFLSSFFIILAGIRLTKYADRLSDVLNLGKLWIGIVLLGFVTSLPEAITCVVSIVKLEANDLAVGNLLGSNNFNVFLIFLMDLVYRKGAVTNKISSKKSHYFSAGISLFLMMMVVAQMTFGEALSRFNVGYVSILMITVGVVYLGGMWVLRSIEKNSEVAEVSGSKNHSLSEIWINLIISSLVVVVSAMWLAKSADIIAVQTGLGRSFVGTVLLALVTSLPEMVVTLSALRLGAFDLAVGNIFGSNMTNMFIMFVCALIYTKGGFLLTVSQTHIFTPLVGFLMTLIVLRGIAVKHKPVIFGLGLDAIFVAVLFFGGNFILYLVK
ncbi:MAG: cation:H+ antiporter [Candidatus Omnitrophota bacterium]|jgi:cation:H+ antiporter